MADAKSIFVPVSDRPYLVGKQELAGFLGLPNVDALRRAFLSKGLHWDRRIDDKYEYYYKDSVLRWIDEHTDHWTEGTYLKERLERKKRFVAKK